MIDNNIIKLFDLTNIEKVGDNSYIGYSNMTNKWYGWNNDGWCKCSTKNKAISFAKSECW